MPTLQLHQLRVAGVAKIICEHVTGEISSEEVIIACLLHDMGNIIKFNLNRFPEFLQPEGLEYWEKIQQEYLEKYGTNEHVATIMIAQEIGVPPKSLSFLGDIGFSKLYDAWESRSLEQKICSYADMRVGPHGVISIEERIIDGQKRYAGTNHLIASERGLFLADCLKKIQSQIFEKANLEPVDITDTKVTELSRILLTTKVSFL